MATTCVPVAYGDSPWGLGSFGGVLPFAGGPIPFDDEFDIYCAGPCGEMVVFLDYGSVEEFSGVDQFSVDAANNDLVISSGGSSTVTDTARVFVDCNVSLTWSLECTFKLEEMPSDFSNLTERHIFIGTADRQGACAGLFFSNVGLAYTGSTNYDNDNNLVVNSVMQVLPNSLGLVQPNVYYTIRLVVDANTDTTYIYVTPTADVPAIGHQLKYVLKTIPSASQVVPPEDGTTISVRGTVSEPSILHLNTLCLGNGVIIPNLPPVADAGVDQAARSCSIVRLDGRKSFDPEGANILYKWRLIDGPMTSAFVLTGDDGHTLGSIQTNKFYSDEAQVFDDMPGIVAGDVLLVDGEPHTIVTTGLDGNGFYIQVDGYVFDGGLPARSFRVLKQNTISGVTTAQPTFYPDVPGLYKFDLTVFDGGLFSQASNTIVNVTDSPVPRGCPVDVRFLWGCISDFWRLVEDADVVETFWGALAQIAASELLTLWQHEYSKSLRDIQRTFQRRWLHYDLFVAEPEIEETTIRTILAGVQTKDIDLDYGVNVGGQTLVVLMPDGIEHEIFLTQPDGTYGTDITNAVQRLLQIRLQELDRRFTVERLNKTGGGDCRLVVRAPFFFSFTDKSTATSLFTFPAANDLPRGSGGATVGVNGYRVGSSLSNIDIQTGDYLVVGGTAYRILRVVSDPADDWENQRLIFSDNLPLNLGADWVIAAATRSTYLDFYSSLCSAGDTAIYEVVEKATGALAYVACTTLSAAADGTTALLTEQTPITPYLLDDAFNVYFHSIYRRTFMPVDALVSEIPTLQERIKNDDDSAVLRQNIDFYRTEFRGLPCIKFTTGDPDVWQGDLPPKRMWAETTYVDNRPVIEQNFGIPAEFTLDDLSSLSDNIDYLSCVRGLWYAYFNGPTLYNLRVGTQILLGLPFAEEPGTIVEIDTDFSLSQGRFLIQDTNEQAIVRSYTYPRVLSLEVNPDTGEKYKVGDTVKQFAPLVEGVEVVDYIKDPKWFQGFLNQGTFFEVEKFFKFLVRVDSAAFNLNTLLFAIQFVKRIKPTYTFPILAVRNAIAETTVDTSDDVAYRGTLKLYAGVWFASGKGNATMFDQPNAAGLGWWNRFNDSPNNWGFDRELLSPESVVMATLSQSFPLAALPTADSIFYADFPVWSNVVATFASGVRFWLPSTGYQVGVPVTATGSATLNKVVVFLRVVSATPGKSLHLQIKKNGVMYSDNTFFIAVTGTGLEAIKTHYQFDISIPVVAGDVLTAEVLSWTGDWNTYVETAGVVLGVGQNWSADTTVGPGTLKTILPL